MRTRLTVSSTTHKPDWDAFVTASSGGHLLQTSDWGALKAEFGWQVERLALICDGQIVGGAQVLYRALPFGITVAYVPKGPIIDWADDTQVSMMLDGLRKAAKKRRAFFLKLEPDLPDSPDLAARLARWKLRPSEQQAQPRSTLIVDLDRSEEEILASMKSKGRYNIRLAARKGVEVCLGDECDLAEFHKLLEQTSQRDDFAIHSADYYDTAYRLFAPSGQMRLFVGRYEGQTLAAILVFRTGRKAWYMYGASADEHRNLMPTYLLQWEAMRWARSAGCTSYDFWGIPDEVGADPERYASAENHNRNGMWGVYFFKQSFGGRLVRYIGAYDDIYMRPLYWFYITSDRILTQKLGETWHRRFRSG